MNRMKKVNDLFLDNVGSTDKNVYEHLLKFSFMAYTGWHYTDLPSVKRTHGVGQAGFMGGVMEAAAKEIALKLLLSPVLLPFTVITFALGAIGALITGFAHLAALAGAGVADASEALPLVAVGCALLCGS